MADLAGRRAELVRALGQARDEVSGALARADPELLTAPGLVGEWSAKELVAHLAYWDDWASTCLEAASAGRLADLVTDEWDVDAQNAAVAAEVASLSISAVLAREASAYERLAERLVGVEPELLAMAVPWGGTIETVVIQNGPDHYAEHAEHLRTWFGAEGDAGDEDLD